MVPPMAVAMEGAVVEASHSARPEFAPLEQADWHGLEHGPAVVYLLAHARREAFYTDVASDVKDLRKHWELIVRQQQATLPESQMKLPLLVWFETATDRSSALARLEQVRALPHPWQRRLVETMNPAWLDLHGYFVRLPPRMMPVVGERQPMYLE